MGRAVHCDGCGEREAPHKIEWAPHLDYCDACHARIREYLDAVQDLHTRIAQQWTEELAKLHAQMRESLPDGELPI